MIKHVQGDLFEIIAKIPHHKIVVPHVTNIHKAAGAGFVLPLQKHFPGCLDTYKSYESEWLLGETQFIDRGNVCIANMMAQTLGGQRPLFYNSLSKCMDRVAQFCHTNHYEIFTPELGSGLAGGNKEFIEELMNDCWVRQGIGVTVVEYATF